jgi:hypothetical protein
LRSADHRQPRHRLMWSVALVLAFATGATLALTVELATTPITFVASGAATEGNVRELYDAANRVLRTGDPSPLHTVLSPTFLDHVALPNVSPDAHGFETYLLDLHRVSPDAELVVDEVTVVGDTAMVWLTVRRTAPPTFLGFRFVDAPDIWGRTDVWGIADGRVAERWGDAAQVIGFRPISTGSIGPLAPSENLVVLERVEFPPASSVTAPAAARALLVESGSLVMETMSADEPTPRGGSSTTVRATDGVLSWATETRIRLSNQSQQQVSMVVLRATYPDAPISVAPTSYPAGGETIYPWGYALDVQRLAGSTLATTIPEGPLTMAVGELRLRAGAPVPEWMVTGLLFASVETGDVSFAASGSLESVVSGWSHEATEGSLVMGDGVFVSAGSGISWRAPDDASVTLLVVTLIADEDG